MPAATYRQNSSRTPRLATGGRPGDRNCDRVHRFERRFLISIVRSHFEALRPPVESAQYCSVDYQAELHRYGIRISMSGKGNCFDNAMVETFFKTIKSELVWRTVFCTRAQAGHAIARYIDGFYNPVRRHSALDYSSPAQF